VEVSVTFDNSGVKGALAKLLPDENIDVTIYRDNVFLTGKVRSATAAANAANIARRFVGDNINVTNMLTVAGSQQVILKVRVSEMDRNVSKNLTANTTISSFPTSRSSRPNVSLLGDSPAATISAAFATGTFNPGGLLSNIIDSATFSILEQHALVKTLAEPTLTAISGETASFLAGGEFPFQSGTDDNGNVVFEYREFGVRLEFTPVVLDSGRINLQLSTEISALGDTITVGSVTVQSLTQKRTNTTVELPSGGTIMISGLLENDVTDTIRGVPFLKDIPVLGALFRSKAFLREETELVISVTAYLVKPIDNSQSIAAPTDGFEPASDIDHYLLGKLHRYYGRGEALDWGNSLKGPFGYIMR
jgi:pilus assembly protein CpaC